MRQERFAQFRGTSPDGSLYQTGFLVLAVAKMELVFPMA